MKALDEKNREIWSYMRGRTAMRRRGVSQFVPSEDVTDISAFQGVVSIVLRDGEITREEKRLVIKLAGLLGLENEVPKRVYDAVLSGEKLEAGNKLSKGKCLDVYSKMFQTAYLNASISEDEYLVVAYLRYIFGISDQENEVVIDTIHSELEEHVEKNVFQVVEKGLDQAKEAVDGLFNRILSILPEGVTKGEQQ